MRSAELLRRGAMLDLDVGRREEKYRPSEGSAGTGIVFSRGGTEAGSHRIADRIEAKEAVLVIAGLGQPSHREWAGVS